MLKYIYGAVVFHRRFLVSLCISCLDAQIKRDTRPFIARFRSVFSIRAIEKAIFVPTQQIHRKKIPATLRLPDDYLRDGSESLSTTSSPSQSNGGNSLREPSEKRV